MNKRIILIGALLGAAFFGAIVSNLVVAQQSKPQPPTGVDRAAIEQIVRDTIREEPGIIVEALNLYSENHLKDGIRARLPELLSEQTAHIAGKNAATANVAVIEFFDYHCGFCKRSADFVRELSNSNPNIKVVFRELPILREESEIASRYALAAREQGKYLELHFAMLAESGVITEARIKEIAAGLGMDVKKLEADQKNPNIAEILDSDRRAAREMGIDGTPTFVIASLDGDFIEVIGGFRPDEVKKAISEAAKKK